MMKIAFCDLCDQEGHSRTEAIGRYKDTVGKWWDICKRHLKLVKEAGGLQWQTTVLDDTSELG